jgi:hypothetical protein
MPRRGGARPVVRPDDRRLGKYWTDERRAEHAARMKVTASLRTFESRSAQGQAVNERRYRCAECGLLSTAMGVALHQKKHEDHEGRVDVREYPDWVG